jgi:hypothetical protein
MSLVCPLWRIMAIRMGERWEGMTLPIGHHLMKKPVISTSGPSTCL